MKTDEWRIFTGNLSIRSSRLHLIIMWNKPFLVFDLFPDSTIFDSAFINLNFTENDFT